VHSGTAGSIMNLNTTRLGGGGFAIANNGSARLYLGSANWMGVSGEGTGTTSVALGSAENSPIIFVTSAATTATERMRITSDGKVLIGTAVSNAYRLRLNTTGTSGSILWVDRDSISAQMFISTSADFYITTNNSFGVFLANGATSWSAYSDIRLKTITGKIENAVSDLKSLSSIKYYLNSDKSKTNRVGLIAQEIEKILPEAVDKDEKGILSVRYTEIIPLLIASIQEQQIEIENLKSRI